MAFREIKLIFSVIIYFLFFCSPVLADILSGSVNEARFIPGSGVVVDGKTGSPIGGAIVSIPSEGISFVTAGNGTFQLRIPGDKTMILSVKKDGYKPFSLSLDSQSALKPMKIAISEQLLQNIVIDSQLHHLGDDKFSQRSANAGEFASKAIGPYFFHEFYVENINPAKNIELVIGSIIGIDTKLAQRFFQSKVRTTASTPVKIYVNSRQIGEISVNGDNQSFPVPGDLLKPNRYNVVRIETGVNLNSDSDIDYDDIEFMNLFLEF